METILVVDDTPANLKLLTTVLRAAGYTVVTATSVVEARDVLGSATPSLVLMDLQLPEIDGLTFTAELRENPSTKDLVIVAVTSFAMKGDREKSLAAGCDDHLTKPIDTRALPKLVAGYLARRRTRG